jgi:hypothetical protein
MQSFHKGDYYGGEELRLYAGLGVRYKRKRSEIVWLITANSLTGSPGVPGGPSGPLEPYMPRRT